MSSVSAVEGPTRTTLRSARPADDPWFELDPSDLARDDIFDPTLDETFSDVKQRERREQREAVLRKRLGDPKSARGAYFGVAIKDNHLTHARFRVLCYHLNAGDPDLSNSFTGRTTAARELGMKLPTYDTHMAALRNDGYIRTQEFRKDDGTQSSSGIQFRLPGRLFFSGEAWADSPCRWNKRISGVPKRNRKHA
ncbi:MAG: hypothetical protein ACXU9Z_07625 [Gemmatimonadaceae bacterium]